MQMPIAARSVRPYMWIVSGPMSTAPFDGDGIEASRFEASGLTVRHSPFTTGCLSATRAPERLTPGAVAGRQECRMSVVLEQDLKSKVDRAAALEQAHRVMQVDLVRG